MVTVADVLKLLEETSHWRVFGVSAKTQEEFDELLFWLVAVFAVEQRIEDPQAAVEEGIISKETVLGEKAEAIYYALLEIAKAAPLQARELMMTLITKCPQIPDHTNKACSG